MGYSSEIQDAVIIGGSFAGLGAAMPLARARRRVTLIDAERPRNRSAAHSWGLLGQDGVAPAEIRARGRAELERYPTFAFRKGEVTEVARDGERFSVHLAGGGILPARRLLLATGMTDKLPAIPGLAERWGASVAQCPYCHGYEFDRKPLIVLADAPERMAMAEHHALLIRDWSPDVTLVTPVPPGPEAAEKLLAWGVRTVVGTAARLEGPGRELNALVLADGRRVPGAGLFLLVRSRPAGELVTRLGLRLEEGPLGPYVQAGPTGATSVEGIFAAGDLAAPFASAVQALASGNRAGAGLHRALLGL